VTINDNAPTPTQTVALSGTGTAGPMLFSPTSLSFAGVAPGSTTTQTVTLSNTTTSAITLTSFKSSAQFAQTNNCPGSLAAGANCSLSVSYTPTTASTTGTVTVAYSGASSGSAQLYLSGSVNYVPLSPTTYNFGTVQEGAAGTSNTFTLTNNYTQAITISSIATTLSDYTTSTTCPASPTTLAVGQSCNITVTFTPSAAGTRSDTLTVSHSAPDSPTTATLTGVGAAPTGVIFSPTALALGSTQVGQTSGSQNVTLTNDSSAALTISSIAVSSDFISPSNTCVSASPLAIGSSCTIAVEFQPLATGMLSGSITVTDSGPSSPQQVALSGTGTTGPVLFSPTSVAFPSTTVGATSATQSVTLTNTQSTSLTISSIAASAGFTQTNNCGATPATLAANGTCTLTVAFAPTSTGSQTGTVNVNYGSGIQTLYLSGTATSNTGSGSVTVSPKSYTFSSAAGNMNQAVGTTSAPVAITLSNGLTTALSISSIQIAAPFAQTNNCGTSLGAGLSCTISVTYSPTAVGYSSATLTITDSASNSPQSVAIAGNAVTAVALTPASGGLGFYSQIVQTTSTSQTITINNNLSTTLTFNSITSTADYPFTTGCVGTNGTGTLASQASCVVYVSFDPQATGSRPGTLSISESFDKNPLTVPLTGSGISGDLGPSVIVEPAGPCVPPSGTQQFSVTTYDPSSAAVKWYVNGVLNGNSTQGTISSSGLYTAPSSTGTHTITAVTTGTPTAASGTSTLTITTAPLFEIYPYTSSLPPGGKQTFQAQTCTVPDTLPVTFTVDGIAGGNATVGTVTSAGVYTAPAAAGKHTVKVTDASINKTSGAVVTVFSAISADFGSRTNTTYPVKANLFGAGRGESLQTTEDRSLLTDAGITVSRLYAQIPLVYATQTPDWTKVDPLIASVQAAGQYVMLQVSLSPPFLQPTSGACANNSAAAPTSNSQWAAIAAAYVAHMDANFPGVVTDYEIWNEPNATGMCSSNNLNSYIALYAAAAPAMKQQAATDGATIRVGGPVLSGFSATWINTLLTTASTYPYVDFISYHNYLFGGGQRQVEWDTYNGAPSLYQETTDPSNGAQEIYSKVYAAVAAGKQPSPTQTPIYVTEFNTNFAFAQDCCRNDPTYAPLWNALYVTDMVNGAYSGLPVPSKLAYFAGSAYPWFCLIGTPDQNMDCEYSRGSAPQPYPQYYMYQLLAASNYLGLSAGGYLAPTITPPTGGGGPVILAFYNATQDAIMITNPTSASYSQLPVTLLNTGLTSPQATLYQIENGTSIVASSLSLTPSGSGYTTTVTIPPYSVMGISLKGQ
jgi:hypothetical protein